VELVWGVEIHLVRGKFFDIKGIASCAVLNQPERRRRIYLLESCISFNLKNDYCDFFF